MRKTTFLTSEARGITRAISHYILLGSCMLQNANYQIIIVLFIFVSGKDFVPLGK